MAAKLSQLKEKGTVANDIAFITGASGGIGHAIARMLAVSGEGRIRIGLHYNSNPELVRSLQKEIPNSFLVGADLERGDACEKIMAAVKAEGNPYILINNAGISEPHEPVLHIQKSSFDRMMAVNFTTHLFLMQAFAQEMIRAESGIIINISSILANYGVMGSASYRVTKAALEAATKQFAMELAPRGVRVNAVAPGFIKTAMTDSLPEDLKEKILAKIGGKLGRPEDVASAVKQLIENDYINGAVIRLDGGLCS
jgi:3-oxoacyl-[acyl-carrier protein] reductase